MTEDGDEKKGYIEHSSTSYWEQYNIGTSQEDNTFSSRGVSSGAKSMRRWQARSVHLSSGSAGTLCRQHGNACPANNIYKDKLILQVFSMNNFIYSKIIDPCAHYILEYKIL